jgi:hypothetical protein
LSGEVGAAGGQTLFVLLEDPLPRRLEVGDDVGFGAAVGEVDLHELFELEHRPVSGLTQPGRQGPTTFRGDGVSGSRATPDRVVRRGRIAVGDELLRFLVQLALGSGPEPPQAAVDLLHQLVRGPRLDGQKSEDCVRGGRQ